MSTNESTDRKVTAEELFTALRSIAMFGDIDELPSEADDIESDTYHADLDREQEVRVQFSALFARLARGHQLPSELGVREDTAIVNRWLRQNDPRSGWWKCPECGTQLTIFGGEIPARMWTWTGSVWTHKCALAKAPVTAVLIDRNPG